MIIISFCIFHILLLVLGGYYYCYQSEKIEYNKGIYPKCGERLSYFDSDSQDGKGYICHQCEYTIWLSWFNSK
jgi:hypothetical protein